MASAKKATIDEVFDSKGVPNLAFVKDLFLHEGRFSDEAVYKVVERVSEIYKKEPNLLTIDNNIIS